jgi:hypothetical protein
MLWTMTCCADDRTLTDQEAHSAHDRVVGGLTEHLTIQIR